MGLFVLSFSLLPSQCLQQHHAGPKYQASHHPYGLSKAVGEPQKTSGSYWLQRLCTLCMDSLNLSL